MKVIGTIEARMGSTRLPGKTLMEVHNGMSLLECVVRRFKQCATLDDVIVATTVEPADDPIVAWCNANRVSVFRGSEHNVLERVAGAAKSFGADVIVQMGADSAYLDYVLIDQLVTYYQSGQFDYVCNDLRLTYPLGIYGHVVRVQKLIELSRKCGLNENDKSDVVRYIWEHPEEYAIANIEAPGELYYPQLRLTIDYPEDMDQAGAVYDYFGSPFFTTEQVLELNRARPELFAKTGKLVQESAPFLDTRVK